MKAETSNLLSLLGPGLASVLSLGLLSGALAQTPAPAETAPVPAPPQAEAPPPPPAAPPQTDVERRLKELEETVRRQNELIRRLEQTVETLRAAPSQAVPPAAPGAAAPPAPAEPAGTAPPKPGRKNDGFTIAGAPDFNLRLRALLHTDARLFPADQGLTGVDSLSLRRARLYFTGTAGRLAEFYFQTAFDEGKGSIQDAYVDVRQAPQLQFRAGLFKTPFSLERLQSGGDLLFVERSIAQNLAPNRDTGFMLHGEGLRGRLAYALAVQNGAPDGSTAYSDPGRGKDFAARLFARPFLARQGTPLQGIGFGLGVTHGTRDEPFTESLRTDSREPFFTYRSGTTYDGTVTRLAPQFHHYYRQFGLMGEAYFTRERVKREGLAAALQNRGWFLQGSYVLTGEPAGYRSVNPRHPFDPARHQWGAYELALRYSEVDLDRAAFRLGFADPTRSARTAHAWTLGLNWYLSQVLKLQLNYEHTNFNTRIGFARGFHDHEDLIVSRLQFAY